jgi:hypothetical protein
VRAEQEQVLARKLPTDTSLIPLTGMGMVISLLGLLAWALALEDKSKAAAREGLANPVEWFGLLGMMLGLMLGGGVVLALIALWLRPAPPPADTTVTTS